jgi:integrase/recombinase XerD
VCCERAGGSRTGREPGRRRRRLEGVLDAAARGADHCPAGGAGRGAYRDTLRLLLAFAAERAAAPPCRIGFADLTAPVITAFLDQCEQQRGNSIRTRNARLAAIHSLFGYPALRHPEHAADIERVLAIPPKRASQTIVTYLTGDEAGALLAAPGRSTRTGRRDHAWILLAIQTGLRASELTGLAIGVCQLFGSVPLSVVTVRG